MNFLKENRKLAAAVLAAAVLFALCFGVWRSVYTLAGRVEKAFIQEDEFGESVQSTLADLQNHARSFAMLYAETVGDDSACEELREAAGTLLKDIENPAKLGESYDRLTAAALRMYETAQTAGLYEGRLRGAYLWLDNDFSILRKYTDYNKAARAYNRETAHFPASLFAGERAVVFD